MGGGRGDLHPPNTKIKLDHLDLGMSFDKHVKKKGGGGETHLK